MSYKINQVSQKIGIKPQVIRYYEHEGILKNISREANGYRSYTEDDIEYIRFLEIVKKLKRNSLPLIELREYGKIVNGEISDSNEAEFLLNGEYIKINNMIKELVEAQTFIEQKMKEYS
ncbi:MerR family transcriptional regulator [Carnobacterium gallinarum]|uniref:MerR family transcriptional regulator n=1 Tax=Carnobacterium gallinarum TaxID=2749 RepID=UPI000550E564|nr:MerR family transcriptional regulator [Carnobacterium gallinarum]